MKKLILALAIALTACNLAVGIGFAAVCQDTKGSRYCGTTCASSSGGGCTCTGGCSKEEMDWVGAGKHDEELMEVYDY